MHRNNLIAAGIAAALSAIGGSALASGSITGTAPVSVTLLSPVNITNTQPMQFGSLVRPADANGTNLVTLTTEGVLTVTGSGSGAVAAGVTPTAAKFNVTGPASQVYSTNQSMTFPDGSGLTAVAPSAPAYSGATPHQLGADGTQEIRFGGTFTMSQSSPAQQDTGTLSVTVSYN